jgi:hypothetical protein
MGRVLAIISLILLALIVASFSIYRLHEARTMRVLVRGEIPESNALQTAEGPISSVDDADGYLTIIQERKPLTITFDDRTIITELGAVVHRSHVKAGAVAKVRYRQNGARKVASSISIAPSPGTPTY